MNLPNSGARMFSTRFKAFSLIELLVAVSIFLIISMVILANHSRFNSSVLLSSLAYDVALSIREAQVFGLSVRQFESGFQVGYGIRFNDPNSYVFFVDTNANKQYDDGVDSIVRSYTLGRGHTFLKFCGTNAIGVEKCSDSASPITHLDVVFLRPDPDAAISSNEPGFYSSGRVLVTSGNGETRSVEVASTGQVSVETN
jgi:prepilin-type N-terminal cleavage/methylation domain-containing protein